MFFYDRVVPIVGRSKRVESFFPFFFFTLHIYSKSSLVKLDIHEHENLSLMSRLKPQLYLIQEVMERWPLKQNINIQRIVSSIDENIYV